MDIFQAVFLGIVQGVTEVLPISSSGHLVLVPWLFDFEDPGLAFNVALHIGTLFAILAYFRKDWVGIIRGFFAGLKGGKFDKADEKLPLFIVFATIPGVLAGYFLNDLAENSFRSPYLVAFNLVFFGFVLLLAEKSSSSLSSRAKSRDPLKKDSELDSRLRGNDEDKRKGFLHLLLCSVGRNDNKEIKDLNWKNALITGIAQAMAIVPGVSRSGITISAGMFQGFTREAAARFSFLISAPIILGAGVYEMRKIPIEGYTSDVFWAGLASSVIASFITVKFLMSFVKNHNLNIFAYYRFFLAGIILLIYFIGS
ncbi:undecaprenyl-diphosphate phosphatase [candidate division WS5 bacterium]|uniref:Undecaprenyl-diphosphatase n=1 Tax=candidate division WS5 bacterium TaxID=2093353 RepID=A0A419DCH7_9BACT|nr:MAG: undecaprenyl-diphosphate phosphatase [candidate division WS5 bacterium]